MFAAKHIPYTETKSFSRIILDYLNEDDKLRPFYSYPVSTAGMKQAMQAREQFAVDRKTLTEVLQEQYSGIDIAEKVLENVRALQSPDTFTVCTAHQPNLFTGPLYFVYKVLHAIRLAAFLQEQFPQQRFVPVYYMGSEDADFAELNHTYVNGKKIEWKKEQSGAVGRMVVDKTLVQLIAELEGQLLHESHGREVVDLLKRCYSGGRTIQQATFELVNEMYGKWGLVVLIPDHPRLKGQMLKVFESDLFENTSSEIVRRSSESLGQHYNVQAHPREINLFYLQDNARERIVKEEGGFKVLNTQVEFSDEELRAELSAHPERFSPNVILRGLYQETILPNIAFVGGGGELAYWLQLKQLFDHYKVPFPVLVLRNSFLVVDESQQQQAEKIGLSVGDLFGSEMDIINRILEREGKKPQLNGQLDRMREIYQYLKSTALQIDITLNQHVEALETRAVQQLVNLEKKMLRAERKKHEATQRQVAKLKQQLFPNNGLQERVENFSGYYAKWGSEFIKGLHENSPTLEQQFTILYHRS